MQKQCELQSKKPRPKNQNQMIDVGKYDKRINSLEEFDPDYLRAAWDKTQHHHTGEQLMTKQITLEEALKLVSFEHRKGRGWQVRSVFGNIYGAIYGTIYGDTYGAIGGDVYGTIFGTINGRRWKFIETPKDELQRLIRESGNQELIDTFNQLENNND